MCSGVQRLFDAVAATPLRPHLRRRRDAPTTYATPRRSGSAEVYAHEIPGGQYTNMLFQANCGVLGPFDDETPSTRLVSRREGAGWSAVS